MSQSVSATQVPASLSFLWNTNQGRVAALAATVSVGFFATGNDSLGLLLASPTVVLLGALALKNCANSR
jgi:hypothetical protein